MTTIDPGAAMKVQTEMISDERIYCAALPNPSVIFHSDDWAMIPFSLLWGGDCWAGSKDTQHEQVCRGRHTRIRGH